MFKKIILSLFVLSPFSLLAQTLDSAIMNGNTTTHSFKITGWSGTLPNGAGLEIYTNPTNNLPSIQSYDRGNTNLYLPLVIGASLLRITGRATMNGASDDGSTPLILNGNMKASQFIASNSQVRFGADATSGGYIANDITGKPITFYTTDSAGTFGLRMHLTSNGNLGIGTSNPRAKLAVNGTILAQKVKVTVSPNEWPDYVFEKDYALLSLEEVEKFYTLHKHLPGMPSAKEVEKDGMNLGDMNKLLLQKVEELTLHIISQQKEITKLKTLVSSK